MASLTLFRVDVLTSNIWGLSHSERRCLIDSGEPSEHRLQSGSLLHVVLSFFDFLAIKSVHYNAPLLRRLKGMFLW